MISILLPTRPAKYCHCFFSFSFSHQEPGTIDAPRFSSLHCSLSRRDRFCRVHPACQKHADTMREIDDPSRCSHHLGCTLVHLYTSSSETIPSSCNTLGRPHVIGLSGSQARAPPFARLCSAIQSRHFPSRLALAAARHTVQYPRHAHLNTCPSPP